jgi:hypothetical protein
MSGETGQACPKSEDKQGGLRREMQMEKYEEKSVKDGRKPYEEPMLVAREDLLQITEEPNLAAISEGVVVD